MGSERRSIPRKRPSELSYIQFSEEIGGFVWNASEQGLGFQSVAPVQKGGPLRLCISPDPKNRIELLGTIVWTDESGKFGGLRFNELGPDTRELICSWLAEPAVSENAGQELMSPGLATAEAAGSSSGAEQQITDAPSIGKVAQDVVAARVNGGFSTPPPTNAFPQRASLPKAASQTRYVSGSGSRTTHFFSTAFVICALGLAAAMLFGNFRPEIAGLLIRLGEKLKADSNVQTERYPLPSAQANSQDLSQAQLNGRTSSTEAQEKPVSPAPHQDMPGVSTAPATVSPDPQFVTEQVADNRSTKHGRALAQELWSKIGAGDVAAEVKLAEIYLKGNGVPRNCEQARVLLRAASRSGNLQAAQRLRSLQTAGCH